MMESAGKSSFRSNWSDNGTSVPDRIGSGRRIDKYEIIELIGKGGMGAVYKALHPHFKKYVAIKEIRADLAANPDMRCRFEQEAELLAQLPSHPNIVTVRDAFVWEGNLYVVMDYIDGEALSDLLQRGNIEPYRAAEILLQILSGLQAIHGSGIIHRDLKASNILMDCEGNAYISDFGIAECIGKHQHGAAMATAKYAAPELIDPSLLRGGSDKQADIYAAGMLAYEMLLGEERFRDVFREVYSGPPDEAADRWLSRHTDLSRVEPNLNEIDPNIPKPLADAVQRMMAKDMGERYKDASEASRDIAAATETSRTQGQREHSGDDATRPLDRMRAAAAAKPAQPQRAYAPIQHPPREPSAAPPSQPAAATAQRRIPFWIWWAAGGALLLLVGFLLFFVLSASPGFALIIRGAPPGSDVYIDNIRHGLTSADGSIKVLSLKAGKRLVRISHDGYGDYNSSVSGKDGEVKSVIAQLTETETKPSVLTEIDYNGPMILIPAGEFIMGDDEHLSDERPSHKISLPDYYIDKFEVTNAQYKKFCDAAGRALPTNPWWDEKYFNDNPNSPVVGVGWSDAAAYAAWAGKRLPAEQEWEKAASWGPDARKKRMWPWGDLLDQSRSNLGSTHPTPTGQYASGASAYGVQDLSGNAAEWVDAFYQAYPGNTSPDPDFGTQERVVRGGSFRSTPDEARTTRRFHHAPEFKAVEKKTRSWLIGFRCAVSANDPALQEFLRSRSSNR